MILGTAKLRTKQIWWRQASPWAGQQGCDTYSRWSVPRTHHLDSARLMSRSLITPELTFTHGIGKGSQFTLLSAEVTFLPPWNDLSRIFKIHVTIISELMFCSVCLSGHGFAINATQALGQDA